MRLTLYTDNPVHIYIIYKIINKNKKISAISLPTKPKGLCALVSAARMDRGISA